MREARITVPALRRMKRCGKKISMLTAYDFPFAQIFDQAGVDVLLVGDSVGSVVQGHATTLPVTLDQIVYHSALVTRAVRRSLVVGDLPFGSYHSSLDATLENVCRLVKDGGVHAVKLEGGARMADRIEAVVRMDVPVMGHIGLTPQSVHRMGGYCVQGRGKKSQARLLEDAQAVQEAGASALVLEGIPGELAAEITAALDIPTIGIGAGVGCDGQVLVMHDLLGLSLDAPPSFARQYVNLADVATQAVRMYVDDVREQKFPADNETY